MRPTGVVRTRVLRAGVATLAVMMVAAASASADTINLTRFSRAVSGSGAAAGVTSVTVDLLRNTIDSNGNPVRNQVDTFTAPVSAGSWSGSFGKYAFSTYNDQVEINYTGGGSQLTIGGGLFLPAASQPPAQTFTFPATAIDDSGMSIASDGSTLTCFYSCPSGFTASVDGGAPQSSAGSTLTFSSPVSNDDTVAVTFSRTSGGTTVNLTDDAPLLTPLLPGQASPVSRPFSQPACAFYLVTSEAVCSNLDPGAYTLTQIRGATTIQTQSFMVPSANGGRTYPGSSTGAPALGGASFTSVAAGDQLVLSLDSRVLSTLTVNPLTIGELDPLGDPENGNARTVAGGCVANEWFNVGAYSSPLSHDVGELCSSSGTVPSSNTLSDTGLNFDAFNEDPIGQLDDTSAGTTQVDMPEVTSAIPTSSESIHLPYRVLTIVRYNDPLASAAQSDAGYDPAGAVPVLASNPSAAKVVFSVAVYGSSKFATVGNVNVPGGLALPALPAGAYVGRFAVVDRRGDVYAFDRLFFVQGNATGPRGAAGVPPGGPAAPKCKAKGTGGARARVASAAAQAAAGRSVTLNCTSKLAGARVAVWLQRGRGIVAEGTGVVRRGKVRIALGALKRGTYQLVEVIDHAGLATEANHVLVVSR